MALQKTLSLANNFGETSEFDCYVRVVEVRCAKQNGVVKINLLKNGTEQVLESREHLFDVDPAPESANVWTQAYTHLKTLPQYDGAVDC